MVDKPRPLIAGNWKMNGDLQSLAELESIAGAISREPGQVQCMIFPPFTLLAHAQGIAGTSRLEIGAQDCSANPSGASTGDISARMIAEFATAVIVGHSERRAIHAETNTIIASKSAMALDAGLTAIVCIGETLQERENGATLEVVKRQLVESICPRSNHRNTVIAYEPVWAIGTGLTPSLQEIATVHASIRAELLSFMGSGGGLVRILYGGSMKPSNALAILQLENVDGGLIGGASLKADDFLSIYRQASKVQTIRGIAT